MQSRRALEFGHSDRRRIFEFVEREGAAPPSAVREALNIDRTAFRHHVAILRRDGQLEDRDGELTIGMERGGTQEHVTDTGVTYAIRPATQADLGGIVGAITRVVESGTDVEAESVAQEIDHEEVLLRFDEIETRMFFVATVEDEVIGWVHLNGSELEKLAHTAEVTVGVLESYRGHGIGGDLLRQGMTWAEANGYERLYQSLPATNETAISFLEHHGWDIEAVREDHYRIDGTPVDEVMLAITLTPS